MGLKVSQMSEENKRITRRVLEELFERGNLDAADELIHPEFVNHEASPNNPQGPEGLKETVNWLRGLWGPMRAEIEDEICEGDKVVARVTMHLEATGVKHRLRQASHQYLITCHHPRVVCSLSRTRRRADPGGVRERSPRPSARGVSE
jgi:predicted SnoaL-like aldol condensation-catalyzing enzyme